MDGTKLYYSFETSIQAKGTQAMNTMKKHFRPEQLALFIPAIVGVLISVL